MSETKEQPGREAIVTESEKLADQMARDIPRLSPKDRPVVRHALDKADAPLTGRAKTDAALGRATGAGRVDPTPE